MADGVDRLAPPAGDPLWELREVRLAGAQPARLDAVTLRIMPGVTAIMGPSGSGKTSLLNLLVDFERPDSGRVHPRVSCNGFALPLFWVPQDGGLWPHVTARQHLEAVAPSDGADTELDELLRAFDIEDKASSYPDELSMGERCRLAVARALASRAAVLVMDEPLVHVDPARVTRYWEVVHEHVRRPRGGPSLVFATHSPAVALAEARGGRVVCLREGRLIYEGDVEELYWRPATRQQAECLGEVNWFEAGEASQWLHGDCAVTGRSCYRPEHIALTRAGATGGPTGPADGGPTGPALVVQACTHKGPTWEVKLAHCATGQARTFCCTCPGEQPRPGWKVILKVLLALLLAVALGCDGGGGPPLSVREEHYWAMPPCESMIPAPRAVAIAENGDALVIDTAGRVLVFDTAGKVKRSWNMPRHDAGNPEGICILSDGRLAIADTHYNRVVLFDRDGKPLNTFGQYGEEKGEFIYPGGIVCDESGNLYVCEYGGNDRVQKFTAEGKFLGAFGTFGTGPAEFQRAAGMVLHEGRLYVADAINNRVLIFRESGEFIGLLGGTASAPGGPAFQFPYGVALGGDESLYVIEYGAGRLTKMGLDGRLLGRYGSTGDGQGQFRTPWALAVDVARNRVLIADTGNRRMVELKL